jgi:hypothetical protein
MSLLIRILPLAALLAFAGCSTVPPETLKAEAEAVGYGAPLPANWQDLVKDFIGSTLKDPGSAVYRFGEPRTGLVAKSPLQGGGLDSVGWLVPFEVNAKNGFGGYTGLSEMRVLIRDGRVVRYAERVGNGFLWK